MALSNLELFQKANPISKLFPITASNGVVIEKQTFSCPECNIPVPNTNTRGFLINKDKTLISHIFCQCPECGEVAVYSDAYEERFNGVTLYRKDGDTWEHTHDVDIPVKYLPYMLWYRFSQWLRGSAKKTV